MSSERIGWQLGNMSDLHQQFLSVGKIPVHAQKVTLQVLDGIRTSDMPALIAIIDEIGLVEVKGSEVGNGLDVHVLEYIKCLEVVNRPGLARFFAQKVTQAPFGTWVTGQVPSTLAVSFLECLGLSGPWRCFIEGLAT